MTKTIFFDFDGVIVDSTRIKTEAFYELFLEHGEEKAQMAQTYHLQNEGVDRYAKINHICENILNQPHDQQKEERYAKQFSHLVFEKVLKCGFIPGALEFLNSLYKHKVPCFLLSATPEAELKNICTHRRIDHFFKKICGSPVSKTDHGLSIMSEETLTKDNIVFFGDSESDLRASKNLGTAFIGITYKNQTKFAEDVETIKDFRSIEIERLL